MELELHQLDVRYEGLRPGRLVVFRIQLIEKSVFLEMVLVEACFPKGPLGSATPEKRRFGKWWCPCSFRKRKRAR